MGTDKTRIQTYVSQSIFDSFKAERDAWGLKDSAALERILIERYSPDNKGVQVSHPAQQSALDESGDRLDKRFQFLERALHLLSSRISYLERKTSESPVSDSELATSELPVSDSERTTSELPVSDSELATSESPVSDSELATSESPVSDSELDKASDKDHLWVICKVDKLDRDRFSCWTGSFKQGFTSDLEKAQTYQEKSLSRISNRIANSEHAPDTSKESLGCKTLWDLKKMVAAKTTEPVPN